MLEITIEDVDHILGVPSEGVELVEVPRAIQANVDAPKDKDKNEALQATKAALYKENQLGYLNPKSSQEVYRQFPA
uniref:Uncharacterized protein n=1 Tax=Oryza meridionalis TaxID=40149 RepID=A0A0E0D135_9ORYZ